MFLELTTSGKYVALSSNVLDPDPILIGLLTPESYIIGSPWINLWSALKKIKPIPLPVEVVKPPKLFDGLASKNSSLNLVDMIGSRTHPLPFPPVTPIEITLSMSKFCGSTNTSLIFPLTTGCTKAVVPIPADIDILGKFTASKLSPPFNTSTFVNGPKNTFLFDL